MSQGKISLGNAKGIIAATWVVSLVTTLAIVTVAPSIFPVRVGTSNVADSAIITTKLEDGSVTSAKVLDGTLTAVDLASNSVIAVKIADGAVSTTKISDGSVTSPKIADGAIVTIKLGDGSVTSAKVLDGTILAQDLADGSIIAAKISDGAVTTAKLADGAVTDLKLAAGAIPNVVVSSQTTPSTTSTTYADIPSMSAGLNLARSSTLVIIFSAESVVQVGTCSCIPFIYVQATVDSTPANPNTDWILTSGTSDAWAAHATVFQQTGVGVGAHTVAIQYRISTSGATGYVGTRTLTVIALPA